MQQLEAGKVKLEADLNQVGVVLVLFVSALLCLLHILSGLKVQTSRKIIYQIV